jgi:hypothetical protein
MNVYQKEDTILLEAKFYTFAGELSDLLADPTIKIYKADSREDATPEGAKTSRASKGTYDYYLTLTEEGKFIYEFSGTLEDKTIARRGSFEVRWTDPA